MNYKKISLAGLVLALLAIGCATQRKIARLDEKKVEINLPKEADYLPDNVSGEVFKPADTLYVKGDDGGKVILLKAVKDSTTGEMVATDVLKAAVITARFRNKAERSGKVDLEFLIKVPENMLDEKWEMTLNPDMFIQKDSIRLDAVVISGKGHRSKQLKGYERYNKYVESIVRDTSVYVNRFLLERYIERNIPELYKFRSDSSYVDDETFKAFYGVTYDEAVEHYTNKCLRSRNEKKAASKDERFASYVKAPILSEGIRLDTVWRADDGDFVYSYLQTVNTRPKLRKIDVVVSGDIKEQGKRIYTIPTTDTLTFYISSLSTFTKDVVRYKTKVVYRRAEANMSSLILFPVGKAEIKPELGNNESEIRTIKENLRHLLANEVFDLDSIMVTANASPDGPFRKNADLSARRANSVSNYFDRYMRQVRDSIETERGLAVDSAGVLSSGKVEPIRFISRSNGENWEGLDRMMESERFSDSDREAYARLRSIKDPDRRDWLMHREKFYPTVHDSLYPLLRTVVFDFHLHRKGMVKDTVQTTVVDDVYMDGLQALKDRDYEKAVELLGPYKDYNAAVAFLAMDRNYNALEILKKEPRTPEVNYMMAILHSRLGEMQEAVDCYMEACREDRSYVARGNLDPEISLLIKTYGLNRQEDEDNE
ncbi:MAG: hypothetical protein II652_03540 [Bacteroidales bacterium]|nr:hypothetical protein [Bacteroidales bacterium]